jgi:hypothetical protein
MGFHYDLRKFHKKIKTIKGNGNIISKIFCKNIRKWEKHGKEIIWTIRYFNRNRKAHKIHVLLRITRLYMLRAQ